MDGHWLAGPVKRELVRRPSCRPPAVFRRPVLALPVDQGGPGLLSHALPPHVAVVGQGDVGEDDVFLQGGHGVVVGLFGRAGATPKSRLQVDGVEAGDAVLAAGL